MACNPDVLKHVPLFSLLDEEEYARIVHEWNLTDKEYSEGETIHGLFERQVEKTPDAIALVYEGERLSYRALHEKSNQLARHLRQEYQRRTGAAMKADTLIALCLDRSLEMVIGMLGILKAGGAYVPLDPAYPKEHLNFILNDIKAGVILTQAHLVEALPGSEAEFITEHYWGYNRQRDGSTLEYQVEHPRWRFYDVAEANLQCDVGGLYGSQFQASMNRSPVSVFLAEGSAITVHRGLRLRPQIPKS